MIQVVDLHCKIQDTDLILKIFSFLQKKILNEKKINFLFPKNKKKKFYLCVYVKF